MVAASAKLLAEVGFDALELHACTGKFLSTFLSPYTNHRTDEYGGSTYNPARVYTAKAAQNFAVLTLYRLGNPFGVHKQRSA